MDRRHVVLYFVRKSSEPPVGSREFRVTETPSDIWLRTLISCFGQCAGREAEGNQNEFFPGNASEC